jgi:hypothetical protein
MPFLSTAQKAENAAKARERSNAKKRERDRSKAPKRKGRYDAFKNKWDEKGAV